MTIEDLAIMVKRGFDQTATKEDIRTLDRRIDNVASIQKDMLEEMNTMHTDIRYIRGTVNKLVQSEIAQDTAISDLTSRVHRLEQKAGFAK